MNAAVAIDVAAQLGRMFGANADRTTELARWIERQTTCEACVRAATEELLAGLDRFPAPKQVIASYRSVNTSPAHIGHLTTSSKELEVGRIEAFWRKEAPRVIAGYVETDLMASWIAAEMWSSGAFPPDAGAVRTEMESNSTFVITANARTGTPSAEQVGEMFWAARQAATTRLIDLDEAAWQERMRRLGEALAWMV